MFTDKKCFHSNHINFNLSLGVIPKECFCFEVSEALQREQSSSRANALMHSYVAPLIIKHVYNDQ